MILPGYLNCFCYGIIVVYFTIFIVKGENQFARRGENVTLVCPYSGSTAWSTGTSLINQGTTVNPNLPNKDRITIIVTSTGGYNLHITNVTDTDTGTYDCAVGSHTKRIDLKLYGDDQFARRGDNATLVCPYSGSSVWSKGSTIISQGTTINPSLRTNHRLAIVETPIGNMNLQISNVSDLDTGRYDCNVGIQTKIINLILFVNPNLPSVQNSIQNGSRIRGIEGQALTITCDSRGGNPPADVTWRRGQAVLVAGKNSVSYTWTPARADDRIDYICLSSSAALVSPLTTTVELYLRLKPSSPEFNIPFVDENDEMSVTCRSSGSRPAALLSWFFRGYQQSLRNPSTNNYDVLTDTYTVTSVFRTHVNRSDNGKPVTCKATNVAAPIGVARTQYITSIRFGPDTVTFNGSTELIEDTILRLRCIASSSRPQSTIVWFKNGNNLTVNGRISTLVGDNLGVITYQDYNVTVGKEDNQANITCRANTTAREAVSHVKLNVKFRPRITISPSSTSVVLGQKRVEIICSLLEANPSTGLTYHWTKAGKEVGTSRILTLNNINRTHDGTYECSITNSIGTSDPGQTQLNVQYPSLVLSAEVNSSNAYEGAAVEMKCLIDANPLSTVVWMNLDTQSILKTEKNVTQSVYMIRSTSCRDTGQYMCSAFNGIGTSSNNTLDLDIQCKPKIISRQGNVEDLNIHIGTKVELTLSIVSNPTPSIKWFFQKSSEEEMQPVLFASIEVQHSGVIFSTKLKKEITTKDDLGMYILNVLNSYGSDTYSFRLQEQSSKDSGSQCNCTVSGGSVAFFVVGAILCIGGICFLLVTVIIKRRKSPMKKRRAEVSSENAVQLYEGINIEEVSKKENTYDDLKETFPSMKQTTEGGSENAAQFYEGINKEDVGKNANAYDELKLSGVTEKSCA